MKRTTTGQTRGRPRRLLKTSGMATLAGVMTAAMVVAPMSFAQALPGFDPRAAGAAEARGLFVDLASLNVVEGAIAQTSGPDAEGPERNPLNVGLLETVNLSLPSLQLPLITDPATPGSGLLHLGGLGALAGYSASTAAPSPYAAAGIVSSTGAAEVDPQAGVGTDPAYVDLTSLFDQLNVTGLTDAVLEDARIEIGALAASADGS